MSNKAQDGNYNAIRKLKITPKSIDLAGRYIDGFLINFAFETMSKTTQDDTMQKLEEMLCIYRKIRGR